jgi:hypothetical protein
MTSEMPDEIIIFRNSNGGLEFGPAPEQCDWLINTSYIRTDRAPAADAEMTAIYGILQWMANEDANYSGDEMRGMAKKALNFLNRARDRAANTRAEAGRGKP